MTLKERTHLMAMYLSPGFIKQVEGFRLLSANYSNGYIYCKVLQPAKYTVNNLSFDLDAESYYFLSATGPTGESKKQNI